MSTRFWATVAGLMLAFAAFELYLNHGLTHANDQLQRACFSPSSWRA